MDLLCLFVCFLSWVSFDFGFCLGFGLFGILFLFYYVFAGLFMCLFLGFCLTLDL